MPALAESSLVRKNFGSRGGSVVLEESMLSSSCARPNWNGPLSILLGWLKVLIGLKDWHPS